MLTLCIHLAAAIRGYMAFYMPTNRAVDWLRSPRGLKWAIPVAVVATPAYLFAMSVCMTIIDRGGPGYLNVLVMLFAWNALKFAAVGLVSVPILLGRLLKLGARRFGDVIDSLTAPQRGATGRAPRAANVTFVRVGPAAASVADSGRIEHVFE